MIAIVRSSTEGIGFTSPADNFGIDIGVRIRVHESATPGMLERTGVGRVRHLDVGTLWLREQQLRRVLKVVKVLGTANPADLMTMHAPKELVDKYTAFFGLRVRRRLGSDNCSFALVRGIGCTGTFLGRADARTWNL